MKFSIRKFIRTAGFTACALATTLAVPAFAAAGAWNDGNSQWTGRATHTYEVTITNLTGGQPLSPPTITTHYGRGVVFSQGAYPTVGLQNVAEWGGADVLAQELAYYRYFGWVSDVTRADKPLVPKGRPGAAMFADSVTLRITSSGWGDRISWASMLGCTNDGFTGVDGLKLPHRIGETVSKDTMAYDAGTERNTESFTDLTAGCQAAIGVKSTTGATGTSASNPALFDLHRVAPHAGIKGTATDGLRRDVHGFNNPVARITVTAVS